MTKKTTIVNQPSKKSKIKQIAIPIYESSLEQATNQSSSQRPHGADYQFGNPHILEDNEDNDNTHRVPCGDDEIFCHVSEQNFQSQRTLDPTQSQSAEHAPQLCHWAYNVSDSNLPFTEKLEKSKWKAERS